MSERRSWIIEKQKDKYWHLFKAVPIEGNGYGGPIDKQYLRHRTPYFVAYEGYNVPNSLCECAAHKLRYRRLTRYSHVYSWADVPWIELIAWGF